MARRNTKRKLSKKEQKALTKEAAVVSVVDVTAAPVKRRELVTVPVPTTITIAELAKRSGRTPVEIVGALLSNGVIATMNDSVDRETVEIIAEELDLLIVTPEAPVPVAVTDQVDAEQAPRPPVVVVLGHVDHGKTTLLDSIRKANVVAGESGGITQHIGAYQVEVRESEPKSRASGASRGIPQEEQPTRKITFIDTPGHEAFSAMRAHGVTMTDIAILVVAADDGVKPQTKEAASHAKAADIPIIVAINKTDAPGAQPDRVRGELAQLGLADESWGGQTPTVLVSAKQGTGIDDLLDTVLLVADLAELKARPTGPAQGVVIEAHMEQGIGPVATILVQHGQLEVGNHVAIGRVAGKVRLMHDDAGNRVFVAGPSMPVRIAGLDAVPSFGSQLSVAANEKESRLLTTTAKEQALNQEFSRAQPDESDQPDDHLTISIVLKADVDGSLGAIQTSLEHITAAGVTVRVVAAGVGDLSESDVNLALAAQHPFLVAFRTGATVAARTLARSAAQTIHAYDIIYRLIDDVLLEANRLKTKQVVTTEIGRLKVLEVFRTTKTAQIIGGRVEQGSIARGASLEIRRADESVGTGTIETLQRGQTKAESVASGEECGLGVATTEPIVVGDVLVVSTTETT